MDVIFWQKIWKNTKHIVSLQNQNIFYIEIWIIRKREPQKRFEQHSKNQCAEKKNG